MKFVVADFSAIEARVLSYLAKESWRSEVFQNNGDIYCASASAMFGVPVEKHGENGHLRQKGKIAELTAMSRLPVMMHRWSITPILYRKMRNGSLPEYSLMNRTSF